MGPGSPCPRIARFGVFELDLRTGELRKQGLKLAVQGQPIQVLMLLIENPGEVVTRDELQRRLWPADTYVNFDHSLNAAVKRLRQALCDSADNPRFVETLPRRGYRFIAPATCPADAPAIAIPEAGAKPDRLLGIPAAVDRAATPEADEPAAMSAPPASPVRPVLRKWYAVSALLLLSVAIAAFLVQRWKNAPPLITSIAVLPLANVSGDASQDYFSDGMTDELITELGQIRELRVISRTSAMTYKQTRKSVPQIARELNVDAIIEGAVMRSGNRVRITAQLIRATDDKHLWAQGYQGELRDALTLQSEVAQAIAGQIRSTLTLGARAQLRSPQRVSVQAYDAYLKGRYFWNKRTADGFSKAVDSFNEAVRLEPAYARAYAGLADSYALMGDWEYGILEPGDAFRKAKAAAAKAIELDDTLAEAHTSLAFVLDSYDWDWAGAEREYQRGIGLNPGYATLHHWYAWHLVVTGRTDQAMTEMRKAENLDPLSLIIGSDMADVLFIARRYDEAIKQSRQIIDMDSDFAVAHYQLGQALAQKHQYSEAIAELQRAIELSGGNSVCTLNLAYVYGISGRRKEARTLIGRLSKQSGTGFSNAPEIALAYVGLGDTNQAIVWLETAYRERFNPSVLLRPSFDPIRTDPRFLNLLRKIGISR
jgi:TolB-like protein/DNA-binding winged helix-turn-helix (wHTH) protein/Tfp pilus assembly protein PilF